LGGTDEDGERERKRERKKERGRVLKSSSSRVSVSEWELAILRESDRTSFHLFPFLLYAVPEWPRSIELREKKPQDVVILWDSPP
jgi:hypothetical protein